MKTLYLVLVCLLISSFTYASEADLFSYDKDQITAEMADLNVLETQLEENNYTLPGQSLLNFTVVSTSNFGSNKPFNQMRLNGIEDAAFFLGCCLGPLGVIMVVAQGEFEAAGKAIVGCVIPTGLITLGIITDDPFLIQLAVEIFLEVFDD